MLGEVSCEFEFSVSNVKKPIVSAEGFVEAGCSTVISKELCGIWMPDGSWVTLHRRQRTFWLRGRVSAEGQVQILPIAGVRREPEVKALPTAAEAAGPILRDLRG